MNIIELLASPLNNIFVVGDDDQSIYGFRGARPEIMIEFKDYYPEAELIVLDVNYRSTQSIINVAGRVIENITPMASRISMRMTVLQVGFPSPFAKLCTRW